LKHECYKRYCTNCRGKRDRTSMLHGAPICRNAVQ
jgi:hypothetical protein